MTRGMRFRIEEVEGLYYLCSENKGADQLRGYRETDLRLCFRICKNPFSHDVARMVEMMLRIFKKCIGQAVLMGNHNI